jgi:hypothetical protein
METTCISGSCGVVTVQLASVESKQASEHAKRQADASPWNLLLRIHINDLNTTFPVAEAQQQQQQQRHSIRTIVKQSSIL